MEAMVFGAVPIFHFPPRDKFLLSALSRNNSAMLYSTVCCSTYQYTVVQCCTVEYGVLLYGKLRYGELQYGAV